MRRVRNGEMNRRIRNLFFQSCFEAELGMGDEEFPRGLSFPFWLAVALFAEDSIFSWKTASARGDKRAPSPYSVLEECWVFCASELW